MLEISSLSASHPQPRLTALLSVDENLAPVSWHMPISKEPFVYGVAMREENYSHSLMKEKKEFALNFLDYRYADVIDQMGAIHGDQANKFSLSKFTKKTASSIKSTLIEEAYMIYECEVIDILSYGDHDIFVAQVKVIHKDEEQNPKQTLFLGRGNYTTTAEIKRIQRD